MAKFIKLTEEDFEERNTDEILSMAEVSVCEYIEGIVSAYKSDLVYALKGCESPIERRLAVAMAEHLNCRKVIRGEIKYNLDIVAIDSQKELFVEGKLVRVDFYIAVYNEKTHQGTQFIIECDGHDFHEKTKEQATRDKQRDRLLMSNGFNVMHFTGSEIFNNTSTCVKEIYDTIFKICGGENNA